jgi:phenylalanyl-tRNA synthetase alpha chain
MDQTEPLLTSLHHTKEDLLSRISQAQNQQELEQIKVDFLAKKGPLKEINRQLSQLVDKQAKATVGQEFNRIRTELMEAHAQKQAHIAQQHISSQLNKEWTDTTLPGQKPIAGHLHPITQLRTQAEEIFARMGFEIVEPHVIDTDFHVFEALNIPAGHPARDMWDTFWTTHGYIPITHTSAMQHRIISQHEMPIRAIVPGRCFRHEATDATHEHTFYQIEGVYVDKGITVSHLIGTLKTFLSSFYEREVQLKIQPSYFPFVEPGLEIMIDCAICKGKEGYCSTCRGKRWIELVPAGLIHPNVLKQAGVDPQEYSGFAWGLGLDRLVMIKYGIEDLRWFHSGDLRFLEQF